MTTMGAVVPRVVPAHLLSAATSLSSLVRYAGAVVGPLLAGILIPLVGLGSLYLFDATALIAVVWAVFRLPPVPPTPQVTTGRPAGAGPGKAAAVAVLAGLPEGFRYLFTSPLLAAVLCVDMAAMVFGMPSALF